MNFLEIVLGYVGAAATKALFIGVIILITALLFVDIEIQHPVGDGRLSGADLHFSFALFGFIIGIWAENFEQLQLIPLLVITPLVFLGGSFYSISMLPPVWQTITLFNPVVYLISGFRWSFFGAADVPIGISLLAILAFTVICLGVDLVDLQNRVADQIMRARLAYLFSHIACSGGVPSCLRGSGALNRHG